MKAEWEKGGTICHVQTYSSDPGLLLINPCGFSGQRTSTKENGFMALMHPRESPRCRSEPLIPNSYSARPAPAHLHDWLYLILLLHRFESVLLVYHFARGDSTARAAQGSSSAPKTLRPRLFSRGMLLEDRFLTGRDDGGDTPCDGYSPGWKFAGSSCSGARKLVWRERNDPNRICSLMRSLYLPLRSSNVYQT